MARIGRGQSAIDRRHRVLDHRVTFQLREPGSYATSDVEAETLFFVVPPMIRIRPLG